MDIAAQNGLDFVIIDTEHGILSNETVEHHICAAQNNGLVPFVRLPDTIPYLLRYYMEMGAMGILVPHIGSGAEAKLAQDSLRYPPDGSAGACRSMHGVGYNPANWMSWLDYVKNISLIALIEDVKGVENLGEILDVLQPGRDMIMFGKADYGQSLGTLSPDGSPDPRVIEDYLKVVKRCRERGIGIIACASTSPEGQQLSDVQKVIDEGCEAVVLNSDHYLIAESIRRITNKCKEFKLK
jgi:4-hydroxy-2-oxoheptanedioate aldolase